MALLHTQSFDGLSSPGDLNIYPAEFTTGFGGAEINAAANKWGGRCLRMLSFNGYNYNWSGNYQMAVVDFAVPVAETEMYLGFWYFSSSYSSDSTSPFLQMSGSDGRYIRLKYDNTLANPRFYFTSYGSETPLSGYGSAIVNDEKWHWIEIKMKVSTTSGAAAVYIDGIPDVTFSGPTASVIGTGAIFNYVTLVGAGGGNIGHRIGFPRPDGYEGRYDDVVLWNNLGSDFNTFPIGAQRILTLPPTRDVSAQFARSSGTQGYSLLDDTNFIADADYIESSVVGDKDYYGIQSTDLPYIPETINAVVLKSIERRTDYGPRTVKLNMELSGSVISSAEYRLLQSYKVDLFYSVTTPTGVAWTATNLANVTFGPEIVANS